MALKKGKQNLPANEKEQPGTFDRKKNVSKELLLIHKRTKTVIAQQVIFISKATEERSFPLQLTLLSSEASFGEPGAKFFVFPCGILPVALLFCLLLLAKDKD